MDDFVKNLSERLAGDPSRRGFLARVGKITLGLAAVATGLDVSRKAEADVLGCCTGTACSNQGCPDGGNVGYTWSCGNSYQCHDCYDNGGNYMCTYAEQAQQQQSSGGTSNGQGNGDDNGKKKKGGDGKGKKKGGGDENGQGNGQGNGNGNDGKGKKDGGGKKKK